MNPAWTETDKKAIQLARAKYEATSPDERYTFPRYLEDAYAHLFAQKNPGERSDPWAG